MNFLLKVKGPVFLCIFCRLSFRFVYIFTYNLFQFCGHTWILANTITRFFTFGTGTNENLLLSVLGQPETEAHGVSADALADTFYSVGFVMSLCQLLSALELFHIADGIEKARLLPRFLQVSLTTCTAVPPLD